MSTGTRTSPLSIPNEAWTLEQRGSRRRHLVPYLVMVPAVLFLLAVSIVPLLYSLVVSLLRFNLMNLDRTGFVGLRNFQLILESPDFWNSLRVTVQFVVIAVGLELLLGLGLAIVLSRNVPGIAVFRSFILVTLALHAQHRVGRPQLAHLVVWVLSDRFSVEYRTRHARHRARRCLAMDAFH